MLSSSEISMEKDVLTKQEDTGNKSKITKASSSSRQWAWLKDPRVVRVSRAFGGKDRHSKVCTIRGLRDRRVRLSVPTAIQLYDLQDRLGLSQPSKVVDWLLNAAKHEIDELPPLQMPAGTFGHFPQSIVANHEVHAQQSSFSSLVGRTISHEKHQGLQPSPSTKGSLNINDNISQENQGIGFKSTYWNLNAPSGSNYKEVARATIMDKTSWIKRNEQETRDDVEIHNTQVPSSQYVSKANNSSLPSLPDNVVPYNSHYPLDSASLSLSNFGSHGQSIQPEDPQSYNVLPVPSALSLPPTSQLLLCPPVAPVPPFFSPYLANHTESSMKQLNQIPMVSSSSHNAFINSLTPSFYSLSQPVRPFQLNINPKLPHSQSDNSSP